MMAVQLIGTQIISKHFSHALSVYSHAKADPAENVDLYQRYWLYRHAVWCTALITHLLDANP